jgi:3-hydroxybutyryl-CoA dehydrogenase
LKAIKNIAVIGAGTMGNGIAHVFAQNNFSVNLIDISSTQLEQAINTIKKNLNRQAEKDIISKEIKDKAINNISTFTLMEDGVQDCDLVIEAATENEGLKFKIFKELDDVAPEDCILATNTSSISITKIASVT